ncbi:MAG TPA: hypothetical protein VK196_20325 [Magnetospirillum sp.]|nr:hypothetical protein [Magnetospirillum sp.]
MLHGTCSPAATTRDSRVGTQPAYARTTFGTSVRTARTYDFEGNGEPSLDEIMDDEVIRRLMARDGVQPDQVWSLMDALRDRLR